ncbi:hypothetical protein GCM10012285_28070 [Streptomyces kronopolitis]|uniref:Uncharacterized protein n=1 Tax=Streptomyces kronopolitis TaxID=1612435 RepID=A0ABQ2JFJ6_9ACTN|nr:hypothetical protein GCM10012285_28070 [Streptomyces kronopolitis]
MIAGRVRDRLKPLASGFGKQPYAFRRDGLSWALTIGLPYTPGGKTTLPCARHGCPGTMRAKATDTVRCDDCELAAQDWQQAIRARKELEAYLRTPLPPSAAEPPAPPAAGRAVAELYGSVAGSAAACRGSAAAGARLRAAACARRRRSPGCPGRGEGRTRRLHPRSRNGRPGSPPTPRIGCHCDLVHHHHPLR